MAKSRVNIKLLGAIMGVVAENKAETKSYIQQHASIKYGRTIAFKTATEFLDLLMERQLITIEENTYKLTSSGEILKEQADFVIQSLEL